MSFRVGKVTLALWVRVLPSETPLRWRDRAKDAAFFPRTAYAKEMPFHRPRTLPLDPAPPADVAISLQKIAVYFGREKVLHDVDLEVKRGEFVALLGPSGGGKSTLLRVIAGLQKAQKGHRYVSGRPAMVFQDYRLLPWRTVWANVALPKDLMGQGRDPGEVLKLVGMQRSAKLYPQALSGGMQARVALARALAQDANIILMDEPFAALDALVRERFNLELRRLQQKDPKTVLFVTHSIREAVYLADRVIILRNGQVHRELDTRNEGRLTAYQGGPEALLRAEIGTVDSTTTRTTRTPWHLPWAFLGTLLLFLGFLALWQITSARVSPLVLPAPSAVVEALRESWPLLQKHTLATLKVTLLGTFIALLIGAPLGYVMASWRWLERLLGPFIVALQAVPTIIIAPLLVLWIGYGLAAKLFVTALIAVFPIVVATMVGVREVDRAYREVFASMGATRWGRLRYLEIPGALPSLLGGLRLSVSLALIGAVVGEFIFGGQGLGYFANSERLNFRVANAVAAVALNVVLGLGLYGAIELTERWALRYRSKK